MYSHVYVLFLCVLYMWFAALKIYVTHVYSEKIHFIFVVIVYLGMIYELRG